MICCNYIFYCIIVIAIIIIYQLYLIKMAWVHSSGCLCKPKCDSVSSTPPPHSSLPLVFSSAHLPFLLSSSFHTHREPDSSSEKNLWNKYLGCITNQLSFVFHFLWLFTSASLPGSVTRRECTLKPQCTNQNGRSPQHYHVLNPSVC